MLIFRILRAPFMTGYNSVPCTYNALILKLERPSLDIIYIIIYATNVSLSLSAGHGCSWRCVTHD